MRDVTVSGYVQKDIKLGEKSTTFQISNYKGKDKDGKSQYQYITVKAIATDLSISEGDQVIVSGELDIFKYNDKYYTQVVAFKDGIGVIGRKNGNTEYAPW